MMCLIIVEVTTLEQQTAVMAFGWWSSKELAVYLFYFVFVNIFFKCLCILCQPKLLVIIDLVLTSWLKGASMV